MMKSIGLTLVLALSCSQAFATIQGASNISKNHVIVSVRDDKSPARSLVRLDLKTSTKESIALPTDIGSEEIMGLILFPENLVMISQWTAGDGKKPHIYEYSFKDKSWKKPTELACISFDTVEVHASDLKVECEGSGDKKVPLSFKSGTPVKLVFPMQNDKQGSLQYKLSGGEMFVWKSIEFQDGKKAKKSLTSLDLLK